MYSKKLICDILDYIDNNINKEITIEELANIFYFDKYYIMKLFKKELKITIINYINSIRIYNSLKDYKYDNQIMRIALNNGFNSLEYYSETFKTITKVSPREYKHFINRSANISLEKIITIRTSLSNLQFLKEQSTSYKRNRPPEKTKIKTLSIFK